MCVCEREREREREGGGERERERRREWGAERGNKLLVFNAQPIGMVISRRW